MFLAALSRRTANERSIARPFSRLSTVINHGIGNKGIVASYARHACVTLRHSWCILCEHRSNLHPALRREGNALFCADLLAGAAVKNLNSKCVRAAVNLASVHQSHIGPVLGVLLKTVQPGAGGLGCAIRNVGVKIYFDAVTIRFVPAVTLTLLDGLSSHGVEIVTWKEPLLSLLAKSKTPRKSLVAPNGTTKFLIPPLATLPAPI